MARSSSQHIARDLERFNRLFQESGALVTCEEGSTWVDGSKVPARTLSAYRLLLQYGAANGHF